MSVKLVNIYEQLKCGNSSIAVREEEKVTLII